MGANSGGFFGQFSEEELKKMDFEAMNSEHHIKSMKALARERLTKRGMLTQEQAAWAESGHFYKGRRYDCDGNIITEG